MKYLEWAAANELRLSSNPLQPSPFAAVLSNVIQWMYASLVHIKK